MKAIVQNAVGEPNSALALNEIGEQAELASNEVLIEVNLSPVHHGDLHLIRSLRGIPDEPGYARRGSEAVGIVRAVGEDIAKQGNLKIGARVVGLPAIGAWAERVVIPAFSAIPIPDDLSDEIAAQLFINYVTARMILRGLRKSVPEEKLRDGAVLVTGASSVVARLLLYFLRQEGLNPIGLARSEASAKRVQSELSDVPVTATADAEWKSHVTAGAAGKPIVGVADCVSGALLGEIAPLLADDCGIVTYGSLDNGPIGLNGFDITDHQFVIRGVTFVRWFFEVPPEEQSADIAAAIALARERPSLFTASNVFRLEDFEQAIAAVEQLNRNGFVFLKPN
jgi:NADPH2:quinone reductase